jgi:hypothetical protein
MTKTMLKLSALAALVLLSACATMFGPSKDTFTLDSVPQGASVFVNSSLIGTTPLTTDIARMTGAVTVTFRKDGYQDVRWNVPKSIEGTTLINLGFITTTSGATSFGIDALSGKMFKYSTTGFVAELPKAGALLPHRSALEFAIAEFEPIKRGLARFDTRGLSPFCELWSMSREACEAFKARAILDRGAVSASPNGLELYRRLDQIKS